MTGKDIGLYLTIIRLYEQQQYMYDNRIHSVEHRIVSISQPWLRPIVRGTVEAPVEFGAKFDLSLDSEGYGRLENIFRRHTTRAPADRSTKRFKEATGYYRRTCPGRSRYIDQEMLLQRADGHPVIRSKAGQTKRHSKS